MKLDLEGIETLSGEEGRDRSQNASLLVIDIQNFFHRIVRPLLGNIQNIIKFCRQDGCLHEGLRVFFLIDGATTGRDDHYLATLKNLGFGFAYSIACDELIRALKSK